MVANYDIAPNTTDINYEVTNPITYNLGVEMGTSNGNAPSSDIGVVDCVDYLLVEYLFF